MISFIAAMDRAGLIGKDNQIPWHLPADLKRFKEITMGHKIVMGRKTFESIGRPLAGRENIILTRNRKFRCDGCRIFYDHKQLIDFCVKAKEEIFVIGGSQIFEMFIPYVRRLYITKIDEEFSGDVFFPAMDWSQFTIVSREIGPRNEKNDYHYEYILFEREQ